MKYILSLVFVLMAAIGLNAQNYKLEVKGSPHGTIVVSGQDDGKSFVQEVKPMVSLMTFRFRNGTRLSFEARPAPGYKFVRWTDQLSGANARTDLNVNANKVVGGEFVPEASNQ